MAIRMALISAISENRAIGFQNKLPWKLPSDLRYFREKTAGKTVVMGRTTYESIGKALPNRRNIVLTRVSSIHFKDCKIAHSFDQVFDLVRKETEEVMVIGGEQIYQLFMPYVQTLYITLVHKKVEGDAFFPEWDPLQWVEVSREDHPADAENEAAYSFLVFQRR